jgi:hypothetical protein
MKCCRSNIKVSISHVAVLSVRHFVCAIKRACFEPECGRILGNYETQLMAMFELGFEKLAGYRRKLFHAITRFLKDSMK